jgi:hypothetical protein
MSVDGTFVPCRTISRMSVIEGSTDQLPTSNFGSL